MHIPSLAAGRAGRYKSFASRRMQMSFALVDYLQKNHFPNASFAEAANLVDRIKAIKSPEE